MTPSNSCWLMAIVGCSLLCPLLSTDATQLQLSCLCAKTTTCCEGSHGARSISTVVPEATPVVQLQWSLLESTQQKLLPASICISSLGSYCCRSRAVQSAPIAVRSKMQSRSLRELGWTLVGSCFASCPCLFLDESRYEAVRW